ncbi:MAG TPA: Uma2 family endonuclease, partial [Planctomycetaceae bacterium]
AERIISPPAAAGIPDYWIADPRDRTLTVFTLDPGATEYREAGKYREGETARSVLPDGLTADVAAAFAAG